MNSVATTSLPWYANGACRAEHHEGIPPRVRETAPAAPIGHQLVTKSLEGALSSTYTPLLVGLRQPMLAYH